MKTLQDYISEMWDICDSGWYFNFRSDQWWLMKASCEHNEFRSVSNGDLDLDETLEKLVEYVRKGHEQ